MKRRKTDDSARRPSRSSMVDLPIDIFYDIMLRLPIFLIVASKNVCRDWLGLILDPRFAELHSSKAKICPLVRDRQQSRFSRALYMLEPEDGGDFGTGYCWCDPNNACNCCKRLVKVKPKLKIPVRNPDSLLSRIEDNPDIVFGTKGVCKRKNYVKLSPSGSLRDHIFNTITSCNGLLCLSCRYINCIVVCNPITGEFIRIPDPPNNERSLNSSFTTCIGFSPKNNEFKVLRVFYADAIVDVHTLGTRTWRSVDLSKFKSELRGSYISFNGALHWVCSGNNKSPVPCIARFNLDGELFHSPSLSLPLSLSKSVDSMAIGVLGDCLCMYQMFIYDNGARVDVWTMEKYGVAESWTKYISVNVARLSWKIPPFQPLNRLSDGALLLFEDDNKLVKYYRGGEVRFKHLRTNGIKSEFEAIPHIPSLASLKYMVNTAHLEIFNVYSRCGKIKLIEENYAVYLC